MSNASGKRDRASLASYTWIQEKLPVVLAAALAVGFVISMIPILYVSFYAHPIYDDFWFSAYVYQAVSEGGGLFEVLKAAFTQVRESYFGWQGTYSAILLFSLQPGAFSDDLYFLTTFIMVFSLTLSTIFFVDTIVVRWMKSRRSYGFLISLLILFCSIQFVVDKEQALYWYNGAVYYTFYYSLALVFFALLIRLFLTDSEKKRLILTVVSALFAIFIAGGNYTTGLVTAILLFLGILILYKSRVPHKWILILVFAVYMIGFVINMAAPGNSVRASTVEGLSAVKAIVMSVFYATTYIGKWTNLPQVAVFLFLTPILYRIAGNVNFSFRYPFIVMGIAFLCFSAQFTPTLYAMNYIGAGRQVNIYYYAYYLLVLFIIFYLCGWISKQNALQIKAKRIITTASTACGLFVIAALFLAGCFEYRYHDLTSVDTALAALDGTVQQYDEEYEAAIEQIKSGEMYVDDIETVPDFFRALDISDADGFWINTRMAAYYGVDYFYASE